MAETLEGEADSIDEVDAGAHQSIAQLQPQQIMLGLGTTVLDGMQQGRVNPRQPGQHLGVALITLAFVAGDGVELARVGDQYLCAAFGEKAANPRAVRAGFQRDRGAGELAEKLHQRGPGVGQGSLADNLTSSIENANVMLTITEIKAEGQPTGDNKGGRE